MDNKYERASFDAGELFSGRATGTKIQGFAQPTPYTPAIDSTYVFHESARDVVVWLLMDNPEPLYLYGPTGSGKSSLVRQLAARLNYPVFECNGHERMEVQDLIGHLSVINGSMQFEDGPLTMAMRLGGMFMLDELDLCSPATLAGLNTILDGAPLCILENGGELVKPAPGFRFVATANTSGAGDDTGRYQGTLRQNLAFLDRFMVCEAAYPSQDVETSLLTTKFPSLPRDLCAKMVSYAGDIRRLFVGDVQPGDDQAFHNGCEVTLSTRTLLRWADLTVRFQPLAQQGISPLMYALDRALGFRASRETRAMLHELAQRIFGITQPTDTNGE